MELEEARARRSIGNAQSVPVVKAEICGLARSDYDLLVVNGELRRAVEYGGYTVF